MSDNEDQGLAAWAASGAQEDAGAAGGNGGVAPEPVVAEEAPVAAVEPAEPAPEPVAEEVQGEDPPAAEPAKEEKPPLKKKAPVLEPWMRDRLAEQTAKQREAERVATEERARADALQAALDEMRRRAAGGEPEPATPVQQPNAVPPGYVPASQVEAEAGRIAAERAFNEQANAAYEAGKTSYDDFDDVLAPLQAMGAIGRRDFQEAALATGAAPDVIHFLGSNPNEASKILGYLKAGQSLKAGVEMTKIALSVGAKKQADAAAAVAKASKVSNAPAPIRPVGGSANPAVNLEKASEEEFTEAFNKKARENGWY